MLSPSCNTSSLPIQITRTASQRQKSFTEPPARHCCPASSLPCCQTPVTGGATHPGTPVFGDSRHGMLHVVYLVDSASMTIPHSPQCWPRTTATSSSLFVPHLHSLLDSAIKHDKQKRARSDLLTIDRSRRNGDGPGRKLSHENCAEQVHTRPAHCLYAKMCMSPPSTANDQAYAVSRASWPTSSVYSTLR